MFVIMMNFMSDHIFNHDDFMSEHVFNHDDFMSEHVSNHDDFMSEHVRNHNDFMSEHVRNHNDFMSEHVSNHDDFMSEHVRNHNDFMSEHVYIVGCHIDLNFFVFNIFLQRENTFISSESRTKIFFESGQKHIKFLLSLYLKFYIYLSLI